MKNLIYIFILLLSSQNISAQTDTTSLSFVSERNTWYVTSSSISSPDVYTNIFTFSDTDSLVFNTDINDFRKYKELLIINDEDKPIHAKILFREEGSQVYTWALPSDEIAYDFSLNVGDTIRYSIGFIDYIVESKDSTELQDGSNRAVLKM
ncbi:MAG: hypothetical protein KDC16_07355, partial [Saprospiraceae bacterium]|nr:hypothetical protein [Saprospiraceae bacterium]